MKTLNIIFGGMLFFYAAFSYSAEEEVLAQSNNVSLSANSAKGAWFSNAQNSNKLYSGKHATHELYSGFYPLIESTGYVAQRNSIQIGFHQLAYSPLETLSISTKPMVNIASTPNLLIKGLVYSDNRNSLALSAGMDVLLPKIDGFFSIYYSSRIDNSNTSLYVVPVSLAHSYKFNRHISFHHTLTDINVLATQDFKNKANLAYSTIIQLKARDRHSLMVHASEVGFWDHDYYYFGVSYRYSSKNFYTQMGYFNRIQQEGLQGIPLVDFGFIL